jgi:hypothetical protein
LLIIEASFRALQCYEDTIKVVRQEHPLQLRAFLLSPHLVWDTLHQICLFFQRKTNRINCTKFDHSTCLDNRISVNLKINRNSHPEHGKNSWRSTTSTVVKFNFSQHNTFLTSLLFRTCQSDFYWDSPRTLRTTLVCPAMAAILDFRSA